MPGQAALGGVDPDDQGATASELPSDSALPTGKIEDSHSPNVIEQVEQCGSRWIGDLVADDPEIEVGEDVVTEAPASGGTTGLELMIYRLNRVPEVSYIKFLQLLDLELRPSRAARVPAWPAPLASASSIRAEALVHRGVPWSTSLGSAPAASASTALTSQLRVATPDPAGRQVAAR